MPPPGSPDLQRSIERQRATNKPIDLTPEHMIAKFLTTNSGWITRKINDSLTPALAAGGTYLATQAHVPGNVIASGTAFVLAAVSWIVGLALSRFAHTANQAMTPPAK